MKLSKRATNAIALVVFFAELFLHILQVVFLTMKFTGAVSWSWWTTLTPLFCVVGLPIAIVVIAVIVLAPKVMIEEVKRRKRVEAEAEKYGMERKPGESTGDLKKRIVRRNMIEGNYSRKNIKDEILEAFPNVGSCQIFVNNQTNEIVLIPHPTDESAEWNETLLKWQTTNFTDDELGEIAKFAAQYIPDKYKITARNVETKERDEDGTTET